MNAVLFVVQIPTAEIPLGLEKDYKALLANPRTKPQPNSGIEKLAENVWLIELPAGLLFLAELQSTVRDRKLLFQLLQLGKKWSKIEVPQS
jgi:hypothetical protein